jgi:hypothetical protein
MNTSANNITQAHNTATKIAWLVAVVAILGAALLAGGLFAAAPSANAGCRYGGPFTSSQCDGPVQPDGTWQRCVEFWSSRSGSNGGFWGDRRCDLMGPDLHPWGFAFADPPTHIDD